VNVVPALMLAAATVGALHTVAPDHWVPFAALARSNRWSARRTARTTVLCGFGHVTVSAVLALLVSFAGLEFLEHVGAQMQRQATFLLIAFGFVYLVWGLRRSFSGHKHHHHSTLTEWSLFLLFCADPCVAVMPLVFAASVNGIAAVVSVILVYELATILTMVTFVLAAHAGVRRLEFHWIDRFGDALAGAVIVCIGAFVGLLGI
jgi:nickel/cobalt exporter